MSQILDDIKTAFKEMQSREDPDQVFTTIKAITDDAPMYEEYQPHAYHDIIRVVRRGVREFGGTDFKDAEDAFDRTKKMMLDGMTPILVNSLCAGVVMGRPPTPVIKKYTVLKKLDKLFEAEGFKTDVAIEALRITDDDDTRNALRRFLMNSAYLTGSMTGYAHSGAPGERHGVVLMGMSLDGSNSASSHLSPDKIFEVWVMNTMSCVGAFYGLGHKLAKIWEERATLEGIAAASSDS